MPLFTIRRFQESDTEDVARLFHETVRTVNAGDYSPEQLKAWAPDDIHFKDWKAACTEVYTIVAVPEDNHMISGFAMLKESGYVDCFYVHHLWQGKGAGRQLMKHLISRALSQGNDLLTSEVSITAVPFFRKFGFRIIGEQQVSVRGVAMTNFRMVRPLKKNDNSIRQ